MAMSVVERFWSHVQVTESCWLWTGSTASKGYGSFSIAGRGRPAHRASYEIHVGPIPDGLELDHLCRVRHCVNPDHLEPVTHVENVMRGEAPAAQNARKLVCAAGHPFTPENIWMTGRGDRRCRQCSYLWRQNWYAKNREKALADQRRRYAASRAS